MQSNFKILPIIHLGRSGSTYFERTISRAFNMLSVGEVFNSNVTMPFLPDEYDWRALYNNDLSSFLKHSIFRAIEMRHWEAVRGDKEAWSGSRILFEYKPTLVEHAFHPIHARFFLSLWDMGVRQVIILERRSALRRIISSEVARRSGIFHSDQLKQSDKFSFDAFYFDFHSVIDDGINPGFAYELSKIQYDNDIYFAKLRLELNSAGFDVLDVDYEQDICTSSAKFIDMVQSFLGENVLNRELSALVKLLPTDLRELVTNADELLDYCNQEYIRI